MTLQDPEQVDDLAVQVVGNLEVGPKPATQENSAHAHEGLDIGSVVDRLDSLNDPPVQTLLASEPWGYGGGCFDLPHVVILAYAAPALARGAGDHKLWLVGAAGLRNSPHGSDREVRSPAAAATRAL